MLIEKFGFTTYSDYLGTIIWTSNNLKPITTTTSNAQSQVVYAGGFFITANGYQIPTYDTEPALKSFKGVVHGKFEVKEAA